MTPTALPVEELAPRTEDEVRAHLAAGKLVEGLAHMSPEYLKGIRRILTVSADTEFVSAPAYLRAAQHAPALNNFGSAVSIIQDELAHAHIGYRLLGDLGVDMHALIYQREPAAFKYPYAFDVPLDSWHELVMANALYDQAGFVLLSDVHRSSTFGPWKRALAKVDKEETFHLRHGRTWVKKLCADPDEKRKVQAAADWMFILTLEWFGLPDERKRHGIQLEYGFKGMSNDELRQTWMAAVVPFMEEVGIDVPAHWDAESERWAARRWTSSSRTSASACSPSPMSTTSASRSSGTPCGRAAASARTRARRCAGWGSWRERRAPRRRLGGLRAQGLRGAAAPRRRGHRVRRGPRARLRALDLRRAAVDPDDHRPAQRDPRGDPGMSTTAPADAPTACMSSLVGSLADNKA